MYKRIVVPMDNTDMGTKALDTALSLADQLGAEVHLLRIRANPAPLEDPKEAEQDLDTIELETKRWIAAGLARLKGHTVPPSSIHAEVRSGPVVTVISETADELDADLIVMGTHGRHRVSELFTGSVAEQIVAKTSMAVLVVKPKGFPFLRD